jgi:hypothetical protein
MSNPSFSKTSKRAATSKTDWRRVNAMCDADIDLSDIPEVTAEMAAHGVLRVARRGGNFKPYPAAARRRSWQARRGRGC